MHADSTSTPSDSDEPAHEQGWMGQYHFPLGNENPPPTEDPEPPSIPPVQNPPPSTLEGPIPPRRVSSSPPPVTSPPPAYSSQTITEAKKPQSFFARLWGGLVAFIATTWKFVYPIFKLAKGGKILLTMGSMFVSVWFYSLAFGWQFAAGFVICILIHELGHVFAAWRLGKEVSAPIFLPGMGALILSRSYETVWEGAIIGFGGPLFGGLASVGCWALYGALDNPLFLGLAMLSFWMNLFNMTPIFPLDGGWITGAVSPYIWVVGLAILLGLAVTGQLRNPMIYILLIMSLPRIVGAFKSGSANSGSVPVTPSQRFSMGLAYVALCGFLFWGLSMTNEAVMQNRMNRTGSTQVAMR
jgi:Zn-dependent protease